MCTKEAFASEKICTITDGSAPNAKSCQCNSVTCDSKTGYICYSTVGGGSCRKTVIGPFGHNIITRGTCNSVVGRKDIDTSGCQGANQPTDTDCQARRLKRCEEAAVMLGLEDTGATIDSSQQPSAHGCLKGKGQDMSHCTNDVCLEFKVVTSPFVCSPEFACICMSALDCTHTNGTSFFLIYMKPNFSICFFFIFQSPQLTLRI